MKVLCKLNCLQMKAVIIFSSWGFHSAYLSLLSREAFRAKVDDELPSS